jgi:O-antigen/teichoic acid export membrane protein
MVLIALGRFIQYALLLATLRISTTLLQPDEMGKVSIVVTTVGFFSLFLINPVGMFINRRFLNWNTKASAKKYLGYFWLYLALISVIASAVSLGLMFFHVLDLSIHPLALILLVGGSLFFGTLNQTAIPTLNLLGYKRWFMSLTIATSLLSLLCAAGLTLGFAKDAQFWLSGLLIGQGLMGVFGLVVFYRKLKNPEQNDLDQSRLDLGALSRLLHFAWPIALAVGLGWLQSQAYRYQLTESLGLASLGLFVAGFGISSGLIAGFDSMVTTYFGPIFSRRLSHMDSEHHGLIWQRYANAVIPSLMLTGFLIIALAPELTKILLGPSYQTAGVFIVWGTLAEVARTATGVYALGAHAKMNTRLLIIPNFFGAGLAVVLVPLFAPLYGLQGIGAALFIAALVSLFSSILVNRRHIAVTISIKQVSKASLMGTFLLALAYLAEQFEALQQNIMYSIAVTVFLGLVFLLAQWNLLHEFSKEKLQGEHP